MRGLWQPCFAFSFLFVHLSLITFTIPVGSPFFLFYGSSHFSSIYKFELWFVQRTARPPPFLMCTRRLSTFILLRFRFLFFTQMDRISCASFFFSIRSSFVHFPFSSICLDRSNCFGLYKMTVQIF